MPSRRRAASWVDELVDHIEFGEHSKTQRELLRLKALKKVQLAQLQEQDQQDQSVQPATPGGGIKNTEGTRTVEETVGTGDADVIPDDRTMRIFWRCGIVSTVPSGVMTDGDDPHHVAELFHNAQAKEEEKRKQGIISGGGETPEVKMKKSTKQSTKRSNRTDQQTNSTD